MSALEVPQPVTWTLRGSKANDFTRSVRAVALAASKDHARVVLTGIHIVSDGTTVHLEACDSYRLHTLDHTMEQPKVDVIVPAAFILRHLPRKLGVSETLTLTFGERRFTIEHGDEAMTAKLVDGQYPNTKNLWPANPGEEGHDAVKAYNPAYLVDIYRAARFVSEGAPVVVRSGLDPMNPTVFDVKWGDVSLSMLLMPVRLA